MGEHTTSPREEQQQPQQEERQDDGRAPYEAPALTSLGDVHARTLQTG